MFKGKIHRATVTQAELNYMGSITIDSLLLEASGILPVNSTTYKCPPRSPWFRGKRGPTE